jgi:ubiquinone/menaquinone biosynthesis C-methylase UbiE
LPDNAESGPEVSRSRASVVEHFAQLAESYGEGEYYARRREAVLRALRPYLARARRILDLGCGNGRYLAEFASTAAGRTVVGADLLPEMLAEARRRATGITGLVRADASRPPFRDASLDFIFASHVLPFVADAEAAVARLARCLRADGILAVTVGQGRIREALREAIGESRWHEFEGAVFGRIRGLRDSVVSEERHRKAFLSAGLSIETIAPGFEVGWQAIEQWVRLRWMPLAGDEARASAERLLAEMRELLGGRRFTLEERILLGRRSPR